jgi:hypothetical protein
MTVATMGGEKATGGTKATYEKQPVFQASQLTPADWSDTGEAQSGAFAGRVRTFAYPRFKGPQRPRMLSMAVQAVFLHD